MSITLAIATEPPLWAWIVWLIAALAVGVGGMLRPRRLTPVEPALAASDAPAASLDDALHDHTTPPRKVLQPVPLLAVTGLVSFCAWVTTQLLYVSIRQPSADRGNGTLMWSSVDLACLSLLSAVVGWVVGFGLLVYGKGVRAVGYGVRRVPSGLLAGAIGLFVALPVVFFCLQATLKLWTALGYEHAPKHELLLVMENDPTKWVKIVALVSAAAAAPLFEEMLFRGCVQGGLRRATGSPWLAVGIASVLFASIHPKWTIPPIFVFSVLLGLVYERTRNLWATTTMHALFNLYAIFSSGMS